jgi:hypothetical protein
MNHKLVKYTYDLKIEDIKNGNVIVNANFTNTTPQLNDLTPLANLPTNSSIFELQAKVNYSGNKSTNTIVYIDELVVHYI